MPKMNKVVSSNVIAIGWENNTLFVEYKSGMYSYAEVPHAVYQNLMAADSKGHFMYTDVKGKYEYKRIA